MNKEALLIIDMSNDFVDEKGGLTAGAPAQEIAPRIVELADQFLQEGNVVAVCMDEHEEDDKHFELWPKHNVKGTWGQQLYGPLHDWFKEHETNPNVIYIGKPEYDAFFQTQLHDELQNRDVNTVHITGVCTDICNFLTTYGAYARGYKTIAYRDKMATFTGQATQFEEHMKNIFQTELR